MVLGSSGLGRGRDGRTLGRLSYISCAGEGVHVAIAAFWKADRSAAALGTVSEAVCLGLFSIRRCPLEDGATFGTCPDTHTELRGDIPNCCELDLLALGGGLYVTI
jgi:hypothetical protein